MMRYHPTKQERAALQSQGWRDDWDGWWWPPAEYGGYGRTYREAAKEQRKRQGVGRRDGDIMKNMEVKCLDASVIYAGKT